MEDDDGDARGGPNPMMLVLQQLAAIASDMLRTLILYYGAVSHFLLHPDQGIHSCPELAHWPGALVHTYSVAKTLQLLSHRRHYRAPSLLHDIRANLSNVAIPGTGGLGAMQLHAGWR